MQEPGIPLLTKTTLGAAGQGPRTAALSGARHSLPGRGRRLVLFHVPPSTKCQAVWEALTLEASAGPAALLSGTLVGPAALLSGTLVGVVALLLFSRCCRRRAASCSSWEGSIG